MLVSYSYYEKDEGQRQNFEYFILEGLGLNNMRTKMPAATDFSIVVNGDECSPCTALSPYLNALDISQEGVSAAWGSPRIVVLHREDNFGMDIAAHNVCSSQRPAHQHQTCTNSIVLVLCCLRVTDTDCASLNCICSRTVGFQWNSQAVLTQVTLTHLQSTNKLHAYKYFVFLNSSVRGPFFPTWLTPMMPSWRWPDAFVSRLSGEVKLVASSIVCLPAIDPGGYGPKVRSRGCLV